MKTFSLLLASAAALALAGCGGGSTNTSGNTLAADPLTNVDSGYGNVTDIGEGTNSLGGQADPFANSAAGDSSAGNGSAGNISAGTSTNTLGNSY